MPQPRRYQMHPEDIDELRQLISGRLVAPNQFELSLRRAVEIGVPVDGLLVLEGVMNEQAYFEALAQAVGVDFIGAHNLQQLSPMYENLCLVQSRFDYINLATRDGVAITGFGVGPSRLRAEIQRLLSQHARDKVKGQAGEQTSLAIQKPYLTTYSDVRRQFADLYSTRLVNHAADGLANMAAMESAKGGLSVWQMAGLLLLFAAGFYGFNQDFYKAAFALSCFFAIFFFFVIALRFMAVLQQKSLALLFRNQPSAFQKNDQDLPIYTLLVPLFRETSILKQLVSALDDLDYPKAKLDIKLLLEEVDQETIAAVEAMRLPPYYHVLIVPDRLPRTKPKALNYGLQFAEGDYVVIYDAEDIPQTDQLRKALLLFSKHGPELASVQAKLNFYNPRQNWFTRQFTVEYGSLFDGLLPCYVNLGFPIPLGGTSNHFRRELLAEAGGWDAYNVTEDADLGMRLYRRGFRSLVLDSTTYEEACSGFKNWLFQRTRWLKGWMQTYYVHMRTPFKLLKELGLWRFLGFQAIIGGPIFSSLVHPFFVALLLWKMPYASVPAHAPETGLWVLSLFNLGAGYIAAMWLGLVALRFRHFTGFLWTILTLPFYWLLISLACYRALLQLIYAPFHWEKTDHKGRDQGN